MKRFGLLALVVLLLSPSANAQERYALGVFHYNIQYVAGGMVGYAFLPDPELDLDNDIIEDLIVTESFTPILELYEKHPSWGVDIELQGYFLDVLSARHPDVLELLRKLAKSGQIDVVSFHYSDQLFIAYPEEDWRRSQALTRATFEKYEIPLSRTVFCQEGQAGMALAERMPEAGYRNLIWPKNLWIYQHGDFDAAPLYQFGDHAFLVVGGQGASYSQGSVDVQVTWTYMDDGELQATGDLNPYFPDIFVHKPEKVAEYEDKLLALEAQGYQIVTVDEYVDAVKNRVLPAQVPPLFDGTWQPNSTTAVFKWMGGKSIWPGEHDNEVRSLGSIAHRELVAAEAAATYAKLDAREELDGAWRLLSLAQVTDASGINPFRGEAEYGIAHATETLRIARSVIQRAKERGGGGPFVVDSAAGTLTPGSISELRGDSEEPPFSIASAGGDREVSESWELALPGLHRVELVFQKGSSEKVSVTFPGELSDAWVTTRALADAELATYLRSDFTFEEFYLALPTGLISLGPNLFLIKDQAYTHLAARIQRDNGDIAFADDTLVPGERATWVFYVYEGSAEEALDLALRINVSPRLSR